MRIIITILFFVLTSCAKSQESITLYVGKPVTEALSVTERYTDLLSITGTEKTAIRKAVSSLDTSGIYDKIIALNIPKYRINGRVINLVIPEEYDGAFALTDESGSPVYGSSGVTLTGTGDKLNTHFINDLIQDEPNMGIFWVSDVGISDQLISSTSPIAIFPRLSGKAYVNIWANASGIDVPAPSGGFHLAQRSGTSVMIFQGETKYSETSAISSANPRNNETFIQGGADVFTLQIFGITQALTDAEVSSLKTILDTLKTDLGL